MALQATLFFRSGDAGWSMRFDTTTNVYEDVLQNAKDLRGVMMPMFATDVRCEYIRVSDPAIRGDVLIDATKVAGSGGGAGSVSTAPWTALLHRIECAGVHRFALRYLHGIPDNFVAGTDFAPDNAWTTAFGDYRAKLSNDWRQRFNHGQGVGLQLISGVTQERLVTHRVGRPFGLPRGRRPRVTPAA